MNIYWNRRKEQMKEKDPCEKVRLIICLLPFFIEMGDPDRILFCSLRLSIYIYIYVHIQDISAVEYFRFSCPPPTSVVFFTSLLDSQSAADPYLFRFQFFVLVQLNVSRKFIGLIVGMFIYLCSVSVKFTKNCLLSLVLLLFAICYAKT